MPAEIRIPSIPGTETVRFVGWLRNPGDRVEAGDEIAEIESEKATVSIESPADGALGEVLAGSDGEEIACGSLIAFVLAPGEDAPHPPAETVANTTPAPVAGSSPVVSSTLDAELFASHRSEARKLASPLARRIARENAIDLELVSGSGPKGRVVRLDVERALRTEQSASAISAHPQVQPNGDNRDNLLRVYRNNIAEEVALDGMRKTIANRLSFAKQTVPHYYLRRDIHLDALESLRRDINLGRNDETRLSLNDFFVKAAALALIAVPDCNAIWGEDRIYRLSDADISVAIAVDGGLYTPVVRKAQELSLSSVSSQMKAFIAAARDRRLGPDQLEGGSLAISNLGMFGIDSFDAIVNAPQSAILAIGTGRRVPVFAGDGASVVPARVATFTLSLDHRVIDGARGAALLAAFAGLIETPLNILV
ncbi:MAG: 2-oxo acid dehydrogenase subunit E2 [Hyphomicrobiaceae bacterium]|nr:2-oxo acid dehydrogenase subunit E2 [Hyphomicrobiaceae bacterium]